MTTVTDRKKNTNLKNNDLNTILKGEISAIEAYEEAIESYNHEMHKYRLDQIKTDHENAVVFWKNQAYEVGKTPTNSSKVWGAFVESLVDASTLIGDKTTLMTLLKGEEHGLSLYKEMLSSNKLSNYQLKEIKETFIPNQMQHIDHINILLGGR